MYILLITLTIAYLIPFTLPLQYFLGGNGTIPYPNPPALLVLLFIKQRASEQAIIGVLFHFLEPARSGLHNFLFSQEASESIFVKSPLHKHWDTGVISTRWLVIVVFFFSFLFYHCFFLAPRLIENDEWELDGRP